MTQFLTYAEKIIKFEEGLRLTPYYDSVYLPTIGYGHLLSNIPHSPLPDIIWTPEQCEADLASFLTKGVKELSADTKLKGVWKILEGDEDRKALFLSMWYQLGTERLGKFKNTLEAMAKKDWPKVKEGMLDSDVARKCAKRWKRQSDAMLSGNVRAIYKF